uniref:NADH dehydrogenase subunit 6 n=1 Tax=Uvitellina sp. SSS-2019 TaxID=2587434 RepID=A0A4Y5RCT1_9TREM|nr:NADH dehydrogenase subunit 6 [Uvitellina sp. SSS-2019]QCY72821.1 NADH dehydrogenase subunit 6 [Uvitellina sp. SSS-2019]
MLSFFSSLLFGLYFSVVLAFSFVSHPIVLCFLLLFSSLCISGIVYLILGFSWYLVLFCLVYIGGVYVLFVFVSIHDPNPISSLSNGGGYFLVIFFLLMVFFFLGGVYYFPVFFESSYYLCSRFEGISYCVFCLILMVGFIGISVVVSNKDSFFR